MKRLKIAGEVIMGYDFEGLSKKIILLIFLTLSLPASAQDKEDFLEVNIEPTFQQFLYSHPDFMREGGARMLEIEGISNAIIGIGKAFPEPADLHDTPKLIRICEIHAKVAVFPQTRVDLIKDDPDDNMILECALAADVEYIITGDSHLLTLKSFEKIKIISPAMFISEF